MSDSHQGYGILPEFARQTLLNLEQRQALYNQSLSDPNTFWAQQANQFVSWSKSWDYVHHCDFEHGQISWFVGAKLNVSYNCIDRHLAKRGNQVAVIWEGDDPKTDLKITYNDLHEQVCKLANALKAHNVTKGDRVCIYLPMVPEALFAMLACARIGAIHSVVFGGFSAEALRSRILDAECSIVITADEGIRGGRTIPLKVNTDEALQACPNVHTVIVLKHTACKISWHAERDVWYHESVDKASVDCPPVEMNAEDPLFILYTSGSTGKPKGVLHTTGGYLLYAAITHHYVFDYHPGEIYWCTADVGWITGHSYIVYGPLANGATTLMFEGVPHYPTPSRFWEIIDKHQVNIFYTAPTALRSLIREGDAYVKATGRQSLKLLGTVGEPIDVDTWQWYYDIVGEQRCPIVDTWWQTETGGILIAPLPGATQLKPGSATLPFFGVSPALMDESGQILERPGEGELVMTRSWPGQMRGIYGDQQRFIDTYFTTYPGCFMTGDNARRDENGYYWISGRADDVINVSGHRFDTAEIEGVIDAHPAVAEAAVVGYPHEIKGQGIYVFVTLHSNETPSSELEQAIKLVLQKQIGAFAKPDMIQWCVDLPKTRSGKIMRRILRKIAANDIDSLGLDFGLNHYF